jgi:hypothetical protein
MKTARRFVTTRRRSPLSKVAMTKRAVAPLEQESARTALDELFALARKYNSSDAYLELMRFVAEFRFYSPFNAMLIYTQMPGAHFVCTALRWRRDYHREIKIGARPIVILQPMGPILFVFDVSDTAPLCALFGGFSRRIRPMPGCCMRRSRGTTPGETTGRQAILFSRGQGRRDDGGLRPCQTVQAASPAVAYPARHSPQDRGPASPGGGVRPPAWPGHADPCAAAAPTWLQALSLHAPEVECIGKGNAAAPYEFGVKASIVTNNHRAPVACSCCTRARCTANS